MRLDQLLVERGFVDSRNKAQTLIKAGKVSLAGRVLQKPSFDLPGDAAVAVDSAELYVSRAAQKLKQFLPLLPFSPDGMRALDIGASTGGFVQVLLEAGAASVDAVDVGSNQLHEMLRGDGRVTSYEQTDIRTFEATEPYDLVSSDVSFISLHHILGDVQRLSREWIVLLFKPQFEVGRDVKRDRAGVINDDKAVAEAMRRFEKAAETLGWTLIAKAEAAIKGKEGNSEYCYCFKKG